MANPLTDAQVVELREAYAGGARQVDLAARFGIAQTAVSAIVSGRTRAAAGGPITAAAPRARRVGTGAADARASAASSPRVRLTPDRVEAIRVRVAGGETRAAVAAAEGVSIHTVHSIMSGRRAGTAGSGALTDAQVAELRAAASAGVGVGQRELAERYGISQQAVSAILRGETHRG